MAGQAPSHRVSISHRQTKERIKLLAGWPSKNGKGWGLRPEKNVRLTAEVTSEDGEVRHIDLTEWWINLDENGPRQARDEPPPSNPLTCRHGIDPMACEECAAF